MSDRTKRFVDRRTYLKYTGATAMVGLAGCSGGGDNGDGGDPEPNHDVPHPEDETLPDSEATGTALEGEARETGLQQEKDGVSYQHTPKGEEYCGNCEEYVPDQDGDGYGACLAVAGKIHPCDWCEVYVAHDGDDTIACEA